MKLRDGVIASIIALSFSWLGWQKYAASHMPIAQVTTVSAEEIIGNPANLSGDPVAEYVIVEFGDYQCPPCARMYAQIEEFLKLHPRRVRFQFRHYPLPSHSLAFPAALMAEKARKAGKFPAFHNALYALNAELDDAALRSVAARHGVSYTMGDDLQKQDEEADTIINGDKRTANRIPVEGTPALFLCTPDHKVYQVADMEQVRTLTQ